MTDSLIGASSVKSQIALQAAKLRVGAKRVNQRIRMGIKQAGIANVPSPKEQCDSCIRLIPLSLNLSLLVQRAVADLGHEPILGRVRGSGIAQTMFGDCEAG